jgi:FAD/FMN-containing dehydrogenase
MSFLSDPQPFHQFHIPRADRAPALLDAVDVAMLAAARAEMARPRELSIPASWPEPNDASWELVTASRDDLLVLARMLHGELIFPGLHQYQAARSAAEAHFSAPRIIAICRNSEDVRRCIEWARAKGWLISARSGGHNGAGFHLCNGLTIDLQNLDGVHLDPASGLVTIGAGAKWGRIGADLAKEKTVCLPGGTCPHVAVAGYTQGGGYSILSRVVGLGCDRLRSARVMLADGSVVTASETSNEDLFWAIRGAGGGQFGIVLNLTFQPVMPDRFFGFVLNWPLADAPEVLSHLERHHTSNVKTVDRWGYLVAVTVTTLLDESDPAKIEKQHSLSVLGMFAGAEPEARDHLSALIRIGKSRWRFARTDTFSELNRSLFSVLPFGLLGLGRRSKIELTGYVSEDQSPDWEGLVKHLASRPNPGNLVGWEPYGGAIACRSIGDTAFPHREHKLNMKVNGYWSRDPDWPYDKDRASAQRWLDGAKAILNPALNGHVYVNYMREDIVDYRHAYWGANFERLLELKQKFDPDMLFRFEQSIMAC